MGHSSMGQFGYADYVLLALGLCKKSLCVGLLLDIYVSNFHWNLK